MKNTTLNRRTLLRGMLGGAVVSIGLPTLDIFLNNHGTALAGGTGPSTIPPRFGLFFWGNGVIPSRWSPAGNSGLNLEWSVSEQLAPLDKLLTMGSAREGVEKVKDLVTVVSGMRVHTPNTLPHFAGAGGILSGAPIILDGENYTFSAPTIDQVIAADSEVGGMSRFRSLEFGAFPSTGLSFNGPENRNPPEDSPIAFFDRIFGGGFEIPDPEAGPDPRLALQRSVLDAVVEDAKRLQSKLGYNDRLRLDQHLTGIFELERRIKFMQDNPPDYSSCIVPEAPESDFPNINGRQQIGAKNRAMSDIMAYALACNQTRVFSNWFTYSLNNLLFTNAEAGHHRLTHDEGGEQPQVHDIVLQIVEQFAYFVEKLDSIPEGEGTLLDNCIIMGTTDCAFGRTHSMTDFPILLAGSAGGRIKQGVHYKSTSDENASHVMYSIVQHAMGIDAPSFGRDEGLVSSGLTAIEV